MDQIETDSWLDLVYKPRRNLLTRDLELEE